MYSFFSHKPVSGLDGTYPAPHLISFSHPSIFYFSFNCATWGSSVGAFPLNLDCSQAKMRMNYSALESVLPFLILVDRVLTIIITSMC